MGEYRTVSLRFLVPEVDELVGPDGLIVDVMGDCYDTWVPAGGGRRLPISYFFTTCTRGIANNYDPQEYPFDFNDPDPCRRIAFTCGSNPCPYQCRPRVPDAVNWLSYLPATWEYPELVLDGQGSLLAADDDHDLWWY